MTVEITANHNGWFEFRLCPHNDPSTPVTQDCLDQHLLHFTNDSGTSYNIGKNALWSQRDCHHCELPSSGIRVNRYIQQ